MNIKKTVKKMTAIFTGATMLGATVMGAMAMDLGHFPQPIITDGDWNGRLVIGEHAGSQLDNAGAIEIASALPELGKIPISIGGGVISVDGGETFEIELNDDLEVGRALDHRDLDGFQDRTVRWDGRDIRVRDRLHIGEGVQVSTNLGGIGDEDFGRNAFLTVDDEEQLLYVFEFRDDVNASRFVDRTMTINLLGNELRLIREQGGDLIAEAARERFVEQGTSIEVDGHEITLTRVGESSVIVRVNGQEQIIPEGQDREFEQADYFQVAVDSIFFESGATDNGAVLRFGAELTHRISPDEPLEIFGEPSDRTEAEWVWGPIGWEGDFLRNITVVSNMDRTLLDVDPVLERPALGMGESLHFPNHYASITFSGYVDTRGDYIHMDFPRVRAFEDDDKDNLLPRQRTLALKADSGDDVFYIEGLNSARTSELYITDFKNNGTGDYFQVWFHDGSDLVAYDGGDDGWIDNVKLELRSGFPIGITTEQNTDDAWFDLVYTFPVTNETLTFVVEAEAGEPRHFGERLGEAESDSLVYNDGGDLSIGTRDYDMKMTYGVEFNDPESQMRGDRFSMWVPLEKQEAVVVVAGSRTRQTATTGGTAYQYPVRPSNVMMLDTEAINRIGQIPMIVVGGPNANTVAAELLGVQQGSSEVLELFSPNRAMIRLFEDQSAILVAGYEGKDTYAASLALANFNNNKADFEGNVEVELSVPATTVTSIVGVN